MRGPKPLYRHVGVALLRAAAAALTDAPDQWPDPADTTGCRTWLDQVWSRTDLAAAIRLASPTLAERVAAVRAGRAMADQQVRRATLATARYLLRNVGRPIPFGLFAGVAPAPLGRTAEVPLRFGALADHLTTTFPAASVATVRATLTALVGQGYLITSLRAPFTVTDPLGYLLEQLRAVAVSAWRASRGVQGCPLSSLGCTRSTLTIASSVLRVVTAFSPRST